MDAHCGDYWRITRHDNIIMHIILNLAPKSKRLGLMLAMVKSILNTFCVEKDK
jgi:hypothetical protein